MKEKKPSSRRVFVLTQSTKSYGATRMHFLKNCNFTLIDPKGKKVRLPALSKAEKQQLSEYEKMTRAEKRKAEILGHTCKECNKSYDAVDGRFGQDKKFLCRYCHEMFVNEAKSRKQRGENRSPLERKVLQIMSYHFKLMGHHYFFNLNHKIGEAEYDFTLEKYDLIIELDSRTSHNSPYKKRRDAWKNKLAKDNGFYLYRVKTSGRNPKAIAEDCIKIVKKHINILHKEKKHL